MGSFGKYFFHQCHGVALTRILKSEVRGLEDKSDPRMAKVNAELGMQNAEEVPSAKFEVRKKGKETTDQGEVGRQDALTIKAARSWLTME